MHLEPGEWKPDLLDSYPVLLKKLNLLIMLRKYKEIHAFTSILEKHEPEKGVSRKQYQYLYSKAVNAQNEHLYQIWNGLRFVWHMNPRDRSEREYIHTIWFLFRKQKGEDFERIRYLVSQIKHDRFIKNKTILFDEMGWHSLYLSYQPRHRPAVPWEYLFFSKTTEELCGIPRARKRKRKSLLKKRQKRLSIYKKISLIYNIVKFMDSREI